MSPETKKIYDEAIEVLRHRKDFDSIDLEMVEVWAIGYFILSGPPPTKKSTIELFAGLKEFINNMGNILGLKQLE